jgi:23S rRNA pseudouridine1911/1915/1917 synthase
MHIDVLYEDNHLIIINKAIGDIVQGDKTGDEPILEDVKKYLKKKYDKPGDVFLGLPHRLDRPVSGILILAKTSKALERMTKMFASGEVHKIYWAIVDNEPPDLKGTLKHFLLKDENTNKTKAFSKFVKFSKEAILNYEIIGRSQNYYLLEVELLTGRHHQIRAQLAKVNCHIKGDVKYGAKRANENAGIHLHARKVEFEHPVSKITISVIAPTPQDQLWDYFTK